MTVEPARTLRGHDAALAFAIAACVSMVAGGRMLPGVLAGGLINPDSYMRLVRLHDMLAGGTVLDSIMRDGAGRGTQLHWSHLIEGMLVLLALPLRPFLGWHEALHAAAVAFGPIGMGAIGIALAWAAAPLAPRRFLWLAPLMAGLAQPLVAYSLPGVVHHHLAVALVAVMLAGYGHRALAARPPEGRRAAGLALGAWAGIGLWFTPEAVPFVLVAFGFTWLAWLLARGPVAAREVQAGVVRATALGFTAMVAFAFLLDPPTDGGRWFTAFDRLSVVYLVLAGCTAVAALLTFAVEALRLPPLRHFVAGTLAGVAALGAWFLLYPDLVRGAAGLVAPEEYRAMLGSIAEMQPLMGLADVLVFLLTGGMGAAVVIVLAIQARSLLGATAALCAVLLVAAAFGHLRLTAYPAALGAAMLPVAMTLATTALAARSETAAALARVGLIAFAVLVPSLGALSGTGQAAPRGACDLRAAVPLLAGHAGRIVLTDVDDTPELLYRTGVSTVGSLYWSRIAPDETQYRRSTRNFMALRAAWRSQPAIDGPALVQAARAELVLHCPRARRSILVADVQGETLLDMLDSGRPPSWLVEVGRTGTPGFVLFEVRP